MIIYYLDYGVIILFRFDFFMKNHSIYNKFLNVYTKYTNINRYYMLNDVSPLYLSSFNKLLLD